MKTCVHIIYSIVLLTIMTGCSTGKNDNTSNSDQIGLKEIKLETLDGKTIDMQSLEGKTVFINFWATWCKPCLQEMPSIEKAKQELTDPNIVFLFASNEEPEQILSFKERRKFDFDYVRVTNFESLNIQALPTTFIFDPKGQRIFSETGYRDWSTPENKNIIQHQP